MQAKHHNYVVTIEEPPTSWKYDVAKLAQWVATEALHVHSIKVTLQVLACLQYVKCITDLLHKWLSENAMLEYTVY